MKDLLIAHIILDIERGKIFSDNKRLLRRFQIRWKAKAIGNQSCFGRIRKYDVVVWFMFLAFSTTIASLANRGMCTFLLRIIDARGCSRFCLQIFSRLIENLSSAYEKLHLLIKIISFLVDMLPAPKYSPEIISFVIDGKRSSLFNSRVENRDWIFCSR